MFSSRAITDCFFTGFYWIRAATNWTNLLVLMLNGQPCRGWSTTVPIFMSNLMVLYINMLLIFSFLGVVKILEVYLPILWRAMTAVWFSESPHTFAEVLRISLSLPQLNSQWHPPKAPYEDWPRPKQLDIQILWKFLTVFMIRLRTVAIGVHPQCSPSHHVIFMTFIIHVTEQFTSPTKQNLHKSQELTDTSQSNKCSSCCPDDSAGGHVISSVLTLNSNYSFLNISLLLIAAATELSSWGLVDPIQDPIFPEKLTPVIPWLSY